LASLTTPPKPMPALSWRGVPGFALFLAPRTAGRLQPPFLGRILGNQTGLVAINNF